MTSKRSLHYEPINHTADLGVRLRGKTLKELFVNAAKALMELLVSFDPSESGQVVPLTVSGDDTIDLLVRWLGEILYLYEGDSLLVTDVVIEDMTPVRVDALLWTLPLNETSHECLTDIKAVTYHQANVITKEDHWEACVIFDV
ncbi:MAG: archease [Desulfobacteraceae bacterium]